MIFRLIITIIILIGSFEQPKKTIVFKNQKIYSDIFQNIYIQQNAKLYKIDTSGNILCSYSNINLGNINTIDVSNPLQILVYYNLYNSVQLLSNNLTPISQPINLDEIGFVNVNAICNSEQGGFWIYDGIKKQPVLINHKLETVYFGSQIPINNIIKMIEFNGKLYIGSYNNGLWILDNKGNFSKFQAVENFFDFFIHNQQIMIVTNEHIKINDNIIFNFDKKPTSIAMLKKCLIISFNDTLYFYKYEL
jgi:hypothetical protein